MPVSPDPENLKGLAAIAAGVGMTLAWFVYYYKKLRGKPAVDPETKKLLEAMQSDISAAMKTLGALSEQFDALTQDHHHVESRVAVMERNGRK
ncbi:MAG: hypothetical protein ABUK15_07285 [Anaerolineales bacterium]